MPNYQYICESCGPFAATRPMAMCEAPHDCPDCGASARRAMLTAPYFSRLSAVRRQAHAINERSAQAPRALRNSHGAGCRCCSPRTAAKRQAGSASAAKGFPEKRPWMISH